MIDRLRSLVDRPLDPSVARAVTALASAIFVGVVALFVLASQEHGGTHPVEHVASLPPSIRLARLPRKGVGQRRRLSHPRFGRRQDPQDIGGSRAARRASRALKAHRALQHLPYRSGGLAIELIGARAVRAVVRVSASTRAEARAGWRGFLAHYDDAGRAYVPVFRAGGGH